MENCGFLESTFPYNRPSRLRLSLFGALSCARGRLGSMTIANLSGKPASVYLCFDLARRLIYVGVTGCGKQRLLAHSSGSAWWRETSHIELRHYETREEALAVEARMISDLEPLYNKLIRINGKWVTVGARPQYPARHK